MSWSEFIKHLTILAQVRIECRYLGHFVSRFQILGHVRQIGVSVESWLLIVSVKLKIGKKEEICSATSAKVLLSKNDYHSDLHFSG